MTSGRSGNHLATQFTTLLPRSISNSLRIFLHGYHVRMISSDFSEENVVLILDEFNELYHAEPEIRDDCLRSFREMRNNSEAYAIRRIIGAGTFGIVYLNPSTFVFSPLNIASHVKNPYFSLKELFHMFALDNHITIDDAVVEDIWAKSNGCVARLY